MVKELSEGGGVEGVLLGEEIGWEELPEEDEAEEALPEEAWELSGVFPLLSGMRGSSEEASEGSDVSSEESMEGSRSKSRGDSPISGREDPEETASTSFAAAMAPVEKTADTVKPEAAKIAARTRRYVLRIALLPYSPSSVEIEGASMGLSPPSGEEGTSGVGSSGEESDSGAEEDSEGASVEEGFGSEDSTGAELSSGIGGSTEDSEEGSEEAAGAEDSGVEELGVELGLEGTGSVST